MFLYLICITVSCFLIWLGESNRKYFITSKMIFLLALLIPAVLAGLRDVSVGIDSALYGHPVFYDALSSPSVAGMDPRWDEWIEKGYLGLNFLFSRYVDDVAWVYIFISLVQGIFILMALYSWRDKMPLWLGMFFYYCFFWLASLNSMRQYMAFPIAFFAFSYFCIHRKKTLYFFLIVVFASFFHKSALLIIFLYAIYLYAQYFKSFMANIIFGIIALAITVIIIMGAEYLNAVMLVIEMNRYNHYLTSSVEDKVIPYRSIIFMTPIAAMFYINRKKIAKTCKEFHFFACIIILMYCALLLPLSGNSDMRRLSECVWIFLCIVFPISIAAFDFPKNKKMLLNLSVVFYCLFNFVYVLFKDRNAHWSVYPYTSKIFESIF